MSFWKKLTCLKSSCYIISAGLVFSIFMIVSQWMTLLSRLTPQQSGFTGAAYMPALIENILFTLLVTALSIFNIFAYPWVRMNLCGDLNHPFRHAAEGAYIAVDGIKKSNAAYKNTPNDYTWEIVYNDGRHLNAHVIDIDDISKEAAKEKEIANMETSLAKKIFKGLFRLILDMCIWFISIFMIWFSLGSRTLKIAVEHGYLKQTI